MNYKNSTSTISAQNTALDAQTTNREWGSEVRLSADGLTATSTAPSSNGEDTYEPLFKFNATDGYTVGFNHTHKLTGTNLGYHAPSPGDILTPFSKAYTPGVTSTGKQQFYMDNMWVGIRSGADKYVVTINDWAGLYNLYNGSSLANFNTAYSNVLNDYSQAHPIASDTQASEHALLTVFGNTINFLKLNSTTGKYEAYELSPGGQATKKNCP